GAGPYISSTPACLPRLQQCLPSQQSHRQQHARAEPRDADGSAPPRRLDRAVRPNDGADVLRRHREEPGPFHLGRPAGRPTGLLAAVGHGGDGFGDTRGRGARRRGQPLDRTWARARVLVPREWWRMREPLLQPRAWPRSWRPRPWPRLLVPRARRARILARTRRSWVPLQRTRRARRLRLLPLRLWPWRRVALMRPLCGLILPSEKRTNCMV
ncbi:hypothetical protein DFJ74DRAFT_746648, partial [Hyaloraphidium curvatum]